MVTSPALISSGKEPGERGPALESLVHLKALLENPTIRVNGVCR